jgi:hypothetical protein
LLALRPGKPLPNIPDISPFHDARKGVIYHRLQRRRPSLKKYAVPDEGRDFVHPRQGAVLISAVRNQPARKGGK